jgi:hypothetical protein
MSGNSRNQKPKPDNNDVHQKPQSQALDDFETPTKRPSYQTMPTHQNDVMVETRCGDSNPLESSMHYNSQSVTYYGNDQAMDIDHEHEERNKYTTPFNNEQTQPYSWRHTCSNNAKVLEKVSEAQQYIIGLSKIWKINNTSEGKKLINDSVKQSTMAHLSISENA